jgi:hypothetical protein
VDHKKQKPPTQISKTPFALIETQERTGNFKGFSGGGFFQSNGGVLMATAH